MPILDYIFFLFYKYKDLQKYAFMEVLLVCSGKIYCFYHFQQIYQ